MPNRRRLPHEPACSVAGCNRAADTRRPAYAKRCYKCYVFGVGPEGPPAGSVYTPPVPAHILAQGRCPVCEALLAYVKHENGVCMMARCRREARKGAA